MLRLTRSALAISGRASATLHVARQCHHGTGVQGANFHKKYGFLLLGSGAAFCSAVWFYACTQTGISWNLSPIGKVTPKEWRQ
ncbi:cytochrome c oxidase subunit 7B, mitochondrial-like [Petromyzon marinus]|uniref:cytochrome c oxidase subunit 7B, mitochondrial-like n=1 Tax=Petromyzon marinus TaxID=7757 RepID=UPI003F7198D4